MAQLFHIDYLFFEIRVLTACAALPVIIAEPVTRRCRLALLPLIRWPLPARLHLILPVAVILNLLAVPLWLFCFTFAIRLIPLIIKPVVYTIRRYWSTQILKNIQLPPVRRNRKSEIDYCFSPISSATFGSMASAHILYPTLFGCRKSGIISLLSVPSSGRKLLLISR